MKLTGMRHKLNRKEKLSALPVKKRGICRLCVLLILVQLAIFPTFHTTALSAGATQASLQNLPPSAVKRALPLVNNGSFFVQLPSQDLAYNEKTAFIPASTLKILTALAALETLGPDYRFRTEFYWQDQTLFIKGYGDPLLTSERVTTISRQLSASLRQHGVTHISAIRLDNSAFKTRIPPEENSANPYDAPAGALAVNFNALPLLVAEGGAISSSEPQTPTLPIFKEAGKDLSPGPHRVNLYYYLDDAPCDPGLRYVAELFTAALASEGITNDGWQEGRVPPGLHPLLTISSETSLSETIRLCLKYSNNFIANQLFLACGAETGGYPATWSKAQQTLRQFIVSRFAAFKDHMAIYDGSGLSKHNRLSADGLVAILDRFRPFADLLTARDRILLKSGTLTTVYNYAGYFQAGETMIPFALLLNQKDNTRDALLLALRQTTQNLLRTPGVTTPVP